MRTLFLVSTLCLTVLILLVLGLTACVDSNSSTSETADAAATVAPEDGVTMNEVVGAFQGGDVAEAVRLLEIMVVEQPENARAWSVLGQARGTLAGQGPEADDALLQAAVDAYTRALELDPTQRGAALGLAGLAARRGDTEQALARLEELAAAGDVDLSQVELNPNFAALVGDPRFQALPPTAEDFDGPAFVEPVRVLHEWRGEAQGDTFGWIARRLGDGSAGDVDGDGVADLTTSAPNKQLHDEQLEDLPNAGRVYVYSGKTGDLLWTRDGTTAGALLGQGIETAGDVNGDGRSDVLAAAPGANVAYVFDGRDGSTLLEIQGHDGEQFGRHVHGVGDVDGDGHSDLLIGAPRFDPSETLQDAGRAALFSGKDGSLLRQWLGQEAGDRLGEAVAGSMVGSENGRHPVFILGAPDAGEGDRGRVYVYTELAAQDGSSETVGEGANFIIDSDEQGAELGGMFLSVIGDLDADGVDDVYASDWAHGALGPQTGRIVVHSGATGEQLLELTGEASGNGFGIGPADAGDADGDGHDDLLVGAWQHASAAPAGGKAYLYSGRDGSLLRTWTCQVMGDTFGFDATRLDDVDGDGKMDYLLTSAWSAVNGPRAGRMFVLAGE